MASPIQIRGVPQKKRPYGEHVTLAATGLEGYLPELPRFLRTPIDNIFFREQQMQTENQDKQLLTIAKTHRKRKANNFRKLIRDEWKEAETHYSQNKRGFPAGADILLKLLALSSRDFRINGHKYGANTRTFKFDWRPANSDPIKVRYYLTGFGAVALLPPKWCVRTRLALGL
jgi:hypothetical protein